MCVFQHDDFDSHEQVAFFKDDETGLRAIIAVHNTNLGPALGGVRMWPYASDQEAVCDVLRLSRGMTYKSALAGLPFGGGKSVIIGDPRRDKSDALMRAMGRCVAKLGGRYIAAEDSGTNVDERRRCATSSAATISRA
jgi:leucine dehydrogenase